RLDLVLDLVERAFVRRRDTEHVVPDIAAAIGDRIVVAADVAVEGGRNQIEALRNAAHGLAVRRPARTIHSVDGDGRQSQLLRGVDHVGAAATLVFHLVAQVRNLVARTLGREFFLDVRRDAREIRLDRRLDGADLDQRHTEFALHWLADLAGRQREGRVRDRGIENA